MAMHRVVLTYDDYLAMPADGRRYEILDGEVAVTATPAILWIADTNARVLEGYTLEAGAYRLAARLQGDARAALPPFPDLVLGLDELWPPRPSTDAPA